MFKKVHVFRVKPEQEVIGEVGNYCRQSGISSGVVIGLIGSVESAKLNFLKELPGKYETETYDGPLEIVCAQGSIALKEDELIVHIHIQLSSQGFSRGGHLVEAQVFSTAEVVIGELDYQLHRYTDEYTGLNELQS
ncbi:MAG: DNA-binding protein [Chloroflexi bacterium]|nr:DNA-binding protein [Chloroflexota bacterium]